MKPIHSTRRSAPRHRVLGAVLTAAAGMSAHAGEPHLPVPAPALTPAAATSTGPTPPGPTARAEAPTARAPFAGPPVGDKRLQLNRAGSAAADTGLDGSVQQTSASHVRTGANSISDGSFANALGLTTVIQNSGANVLIQNATTVIVQFK